MLALIFICLGGCSRKKDNFSFYKDKVSSIEDFKSYVITKQIYNDSLLLYENKKSTYIDNNKYLIEVKEKKLDNIDSDNLYLENTERFYREGEKFYYYEDNDWKVKEVEVNDSIGINIEKQYFDSYETKEENNLYFFEGSLKKEAINDFFGTSLNDVDNMKFGVEINSNGKVKSLALGYIGKNGNSIKIVVDFEYSSSVKFTLPNI